MAIRYERVQSIEHHFGKWQARVVFSEGGVEFSEFIKIGPGDGNSIPDNSEIQARVTRFVQARNAPRVETPELTDLIPIDPPNFPSFTGLAPARIQAIWNDFVNWIKSFFRGRKA